MKHASTAVTAKAGVLFLQQAVNEHGSIFRPVHQEDDVGIDGFIEPVIDEEATGRLVAVQVKSGDSYLSNDGSAFVIPVDERHLSYWVGYMVPVILVAHSASRDLAVWTSVRDYVEHATYHERGSVKSIRIPISRRVTKEAMAKLSELARQRSDERLLLRAADKCLSAPDADRKEGFQILANHPDSRGLRLVCLMAKRLLSDVDVDVDVAKDALFILGYGVGRQRWSWNPNNQAEKEEERFAREMCEELTEAEIRRTLELCDNESFHGPQGLGERLMDVLGCGFDLAERVLDAVARDQAQPMNRRIHAVYLLCECDDEVCEERREELLADPALEDVAIEMFRSEDAAAE
ncbi:MAG: DUF4365 domain-containing protein [Planctomycetota bacterium]